MNVTFFGNHDAPESVRERLKTLLRTLIENENADIFYVGTHGNFDSFAAQTLKELKKEYPHIRYYIVLAYMPKKSEYDTIDYSLSILPDEVAVSIPKFAISKRNIWMLKNSNTVITYVRFRYGGAAQFKRKAISKKKRVIELYENT